jgi:hypothetical protein
MTKHAPLSRNVAVDICKRHLTRLASEILEVLMAGGRDMD